MQVRGHKLFWGGALLSLLVVSSNLAASPGAPAVPPDEQREQKASARDSWFALDKFDHLVVSAFTTGFAKAALRHAAGQPNGKSLVLGASFTFALGLGKEAYDLKSKRGHASFKDLAADLLGIGLAALVIGGL